MLKREIIVTLSSLIIFSLSLLQFAIPIKMFLILLAAILAESTMVFLGARKVKKCFDAKLHENPKKTFQNKSVEIS